MPITEIEFLMTLALLFYTLALVLGRNQRRWRLPRWVHLSTGLCAFTLDMWATWKMEQLRHKGWVMPVDHGVLMFHTIISLMAVLLFLSMFGLGWTRQIRVHRFVAWFGFVPTWLTSYVSGIMLLMV